MEAPSEICFNFTAEDETIPWQDYFCRVIFDQSPGVPCTFNLKTKNTSPHLNPSSLFTAKNVSDHSCLTLDSVGFCPAGGGNAPKGVNWKSPSL